jgi:hypothetical protein
MALVVAHFSADHLRRCSFERREFELLSFSCIPDDLRAERRTTKSRLARPEGKSSNSLVDTLVHWTEFLEAA